MFWTIDAYCTYPEAFFCVVDILFDRSYKKQWSCKESGWRMIRDHTLKDIFLSLQILES